MRLTFRKAHRKSVVGVNGDPGYPAANGIPPDDFLNHRPVKMLPLAVHDCQGAGHILTCNERLVTFWRCTPRLDEHGEFCCGDYKIPLSDITWPPHEQCPLAQVVCTGLSAHEAEIVAKRDGVLRDKERGLGRSLGLNPGLNLGLNDAATIVNPSPAFAGAPGGIPDIIASGQLTAAVSESRSDLSALSQRLQAMQEEERRRIARKVHDELGQSLTALKLDLAWIEKHLACAEGKKMRRKIGDMNQLVDTTINEVRNIAADLRPGLLDHFGLPAALEGLLGEFTERTGIAGELSVTPDELDVEGNRAIVMFRIAQEALTNVVRHAKATKLEINLALQDGALRMEIHDNGRGIPTAAGNLQFLGLLGMHERAKGTGGLLKISGGPGQGTLLLVEIPNSSTRASSCSQHGYFVFACGMSSSAARSRSCAAIAASSFKCEECRHLFLRKHSASFAEKIFSAFSLWQPLREPGSVQIPESGSGGRSIPGN